MKERVCNPIKFEILPDGTTNKGAIDPQLTDEEIRAELKLGPDDVIDPHHLFCASYYRRKRIFNEGDRNLIEQWKRIRPASTEFFKLGGYSVEEYQRYKGETRTRHFLSWQVRFEIDINDSGALALLCLVFTETGGRIRRIKLLGEYNVLAIDGEWAYAAGNPRSFFERKRDALREEFIITRLADKMVWVRLLQT